ncbi:D-alanyl-D-alanine carboxypeptidase family protein [Aliihoeflea sp. PC F10.4]
MMVNRLVLETMSAALAVVVTFQAHQALANPTILVDLNTGQVLQQEEAFKPVFPASLTKLMTTYVAFRAVEAGELQMDSPIEITSEATKEPPSKMGYASGSVLTLDNAIKILMVKSANDVATAIAINVGGSEAAFAARMNAEAQRIGMAQSHFINAHGLHSEQQYTSARDLAVLGIALKRDFPQYANYFELDALADGQNIMENTNTLIGRFAGADGMKTGYTCPSGFNLVASATKDGRSLLAVVVGSFSPEERADTAADLLGNGFLNPAGNAPLLSGLRPDALANTEPANLRPVVCTEEAWRERAKRRDEQGNSIYTSRFIKERTGDPVAIAVSLGGATGPRSTQPRYANVPVPTPRPDYSPQSVQAQGG